MRIRSFSALLTSTIALLFVFNSCVKDKCTRRYVYWEPVYRTKDEVRANIKNNSSREIERPGKIYIRGNYIFLNEIDRGIHIIDNTNRSAPKNIAFIDIPGNLDMAVKGNILYADLYTDLVAIDITDPQQVIVKKFTENIFPERYYGNGFSQNPAMVIQDWIRKDTTVQIDCGGNSGLFGGLKSADVFMSPLSSFSGQAGPAASAGGGSPFGVGGSMARFTIVNNYLYAVSNSALNVVSIANGADPVFSNKVQMNWGIETLYPFNNRLFIGSTTGMFIFDIANPTNPVQLGTFSHARKCDPVIADNTNAFVTLRSGTTCQGFGEQLDVLDISNLSNPTLIKSYPMTNPHGLAKDGNTLIICDGRDGLKFYNASDVRNLSLQKQMTGLETYDVIAFNGWALVVAKDGLYQYDYSSLSNIKLISKMNIKN
ncbi:MAG: hypothetical protein E6H08_08225 [Bacteroidetes bacterium]|nr:MAG: hypothetical protein E6H08_08225 [Bacteroidota bacterium]